MKTPLNAEQLAEIFQDTVAANFTGGNGVLSWSRLPQSHQTCLIAGMEAALSAYLASIGEGMPSLEKCVEEYHKEGVGAVRNLMLAACARQTRLWQIAAGEREKALESKLAILEKQAVYDNEAITRLQSVGYELEVAKAKLAAVATLPEKWRNYVTAIACTIDLKDALGSPPAVDPVPSYHTPSVVQQRWEEAAAANAAMNPPSGKLTDEQLGEIGAKAARDKLKSRDLHDWSIGVREDSATWYQTSEGRTAFAAAVAAEVRKECAKQLEQLPHYDLQLRKERMYHKDTKGKLENCLQDLTTLSAENAKQAERLAALEGETQDECIAVASVLLSRWNGTVHTTTQTLHWRRGVSDPDKMRGIAMEEAQKAKPGFSVDSIALDLVAARASKEVQP